MNTMVGFSVFDSVLRVSWFEVRPECVPTVDPFSILLQHLLPMTSLCSCHSAHPRVHVLREFSAATVMTLKLFTSGEDGGGDRRERDGFTEVTTGETKEGLGNGHWRVSPS